MGCVNPLVELAHQKFLERHHQAKLEAGGDEASASRDYMRIYADHHQQQPRNGATTEGDSLANSSNAKANANAGDSAAAAAAGAGGIGGGGGGSGGDVSVLPIDALSIAVQSPGIGFHNWWAWCQKCKHGGHASHLSRWFDSHRVCPVSDCRCACYFGAAPPSGLVQTATLPAATSTSALGDAAAAVRT